MSVKSLSLIMVLAIILSAAAAYAENLVENPGFENGTNGWMARSGKIEAVTTPVHGGAGAVKAFDRSDAWQGIKQSMLNKMANGTTYKISGWVRLDNSDKDNITISVEQQDESGTKYINVGTVTADKNEWFEIEGDFTLTASGSVTVLDIYFEGPEAGINFFVDDVTVEVKAVAAPSPAPADPNMPKDPNALPKEEPKADKEKK